MTGTAGRREVGTLAAVSRAPSVAMALTAALLIGMAVLGGMLAWQNYAEAIRAGENRASSAAQTVSVQARWLAEAAFQGLARIDEELGENPGLFETGSVGNLNAAVEALPRGVSGWVFDADGDFVQTTGNETSARINVSDRDYFRALQSGEKTHISTLLTGRVSGEQIFILAKRIERDGALAGIAAIAVPQTLMTDFWSILDLGPGSSVSLVRDDGYVVARYPALSGTIDITETSVLGEVLKQKEAGFYHGGASPADGTRRIVGYHKVPDLPLYAVAGVSRDAIVEQFWTRVRSAAIVAVPIALALLAAAAWVVMLLHRDETQRHELSEALARNNLLLSEVHHRVKNNLMAVTSLVRMQRLPDDLTHQLVSRVEAMSAIHEHMYRSDRFETLDLAKYLDTLVGKLARGIDTNITVATDLAPVVIEADNAMPIGLIANEVVTNALKHAFPDGRRGKVSVFLSRLNAGEAQLQIRDDGIGHDRASAPKGMGSRLIEGLSQQASAEIRFRQDGGTVFTLIFPIPEQDDDVSASPADSRETPEAGGRLRTTKPLTPAPEVL